METIENLLKRNQILEEIIELEKKEKMEKFAYTSKKTRLKKSLDLSNVFSDFISKVSAFEKNKYRAYYIVISSKKCYFAFPVASNYLKDDDIIISSTSLDNAQRYLKTPEKINKIFVNIENETVRSFNKTKNTWETCNFVEAGLQDVNDKDEITEHLEEREDGDVKVIYE